jgi:hypothetical protein
MTKMKRMLLLILVLLLMMDLAEDGCLGKAKFNLSNPSATTSVTQTDDQPDSDKTDFRHEPASIELPGSPHHGGPRPVIPHLPHTLQIIHCCHISSSGGIPL